MFAARSEEFFSFRRQTSDRREERRPRQIKGSVSSRRRYVLKESEHCLSSLSLNVI